MTQTVQSDAMARSIGVELVNVQRPSRLSVLPVLVLMQTSSSHLQAASVRWDTAAVGPQLIFIPPASLDSPTHFAIRTKFGAVKLEGRWVSTQGAGRLATGGDEESVPEQRLLV